MVKKVMSKLIGLLYSMPSSDLGLLRCEKNKWVRKVFTKPKKVTTSTMSSSALSRGSSPNNISIRLGMRKKLYKILLNAFVKTPLLNIYAALVPLAKPEDDIVCDSSLLYKEKVFLKQANFELRFNFLLFIAISFFLISPLQADLRFLNRESRILVRPQNSVFQISNPAKMRGWYQESVVRDFGYDVGYTITGFHSAGPVTIGTGGEFPSTDLTESNSNAIVFLADDTAGISGKLATIDTGPEHVVFDASTTLAYDLFISDDHTLTIGNATPGATIEIEGNGHAINFAHNSAGLLTLNGTNNVVRFKDVVIKNFSSDLLSLGSSTLIFGDNTKVDLATNVSLTYGLTFEGAATLQGLGNVLDLQSSGSIYLRGHNSSLLFNNILIKGVAGTNIRAQSNTSTFSTNHATFSLSSNYTMTSGHFEFLGDTLIKGEKVFCLRTTTSSEIMSRAMVTFDRGTTFSYDPLIAHGKQLLSMEDETSCLYLNGTSLYTTHTGLQLTKGTLLVDNIVTLHNVGGQSLSQAIIFGDGTTSHDLTIAVQPSGSLVLGSGLLDYQNTN